MACLNSPTPRTRPAPVYAVPLETLSKGWDFKFLQQFVEQDKSLLHKIYTLFNECNNSITAFHAKWIQTCLSNPSQNQPCKMEWRLFRQQFDWKVQVSALLGCVLFGKHSVILIRHLLVNWIHRFYGAILRMSISLYRQNYLSKTFGS